MFMVEKAYTTGRLADACRKVLPKPCSAIPKAGNFKKCSVVCTPGYLQKLEMPPYSTYLRSVFSLTIYFQNTNYDGRE